MNERQLTECLATMPGLEPPAAVLARWHATLAGLPHPVGTQTIETHPIETHPVETQTVEAPGRDAPRPRADRPFTRRLCRGALMAAAVAAAAVVLVRTPIASVPPAPSPIQSPPPSALSEQDPTRLGELDDPSRLGACLTRRADRSSALLAARRITWNDSAAIQLVLSSPTLGRLRIVVVTPDCATLLSDTVRGR
ncbi:MAG TPA: hypothetical protein VFE65_26275 [Pseudonocardia sp.]|jgi:hypothetical protein|nr:hypothetical protein [Pseudonocardia sp.]